MYRKFTDSKVVNKNLNILLVSPYFWPVKGGSENYCHQVGRRLVIRGHSVTVLCVAKESSIPIEMVDGIKVIRLPAPHLTILNTVIRFDLFIDVARLLKEAHFDLVNAHTPTIYFADVAAIVAKKYRVPFVLTYHNDNFKDNLLLNMVVQIYNYSVQLLTLKLSDKIIVASPFSYHESPFIKRFKNKAVWIPPGVDSRLYVPKNNNYRLISKYKLQGGAKTVLFAGRMAHGDTHKGVDVLLKAFSKVNKELPNSYLILAGSGSDMEMYKSLSEHLGISKNTVFTGSIDEAELIQLYQGVDVVVLPSTTIQEGFGMTLLEGSACCKPVIGSAVGGIKYLIQDSIDGLTVPQKADNALAEAIIRILNDKKMAQEMGIKGRQKAEQYDWEILTDKTEAVFKEVAGK